MANEKQWFFGRNGQQQGPVDEAALRAMAANGKLLASDMVWSEGMAGWVAAGAVPGLIPPGVAPPPIARPVMYASPGQSSQDDIGQNAGIRMLLPVGRSGWAIAAGYLGLFSLLIVPAPLALIFSIIAIRDIRKHPERHGMGRAIFGLIMGIIFTAFLVIGIVVNVIKK